MSLKEWSARLLIERSMAIKSPSIQFQLVGTKRIQQVLTDPEILVRFTRSKEVADKLASTFVDQYSFDVTTTFSTFFIYFLFTLICIIKLEREF
jgi:hypothetical protein